MLPNIATNLRKCDSLTLVFLCLNSYLISLNYFSLLKHFLVSVSCLFFYLVNCCFHSVGLFFVVIISLFLYRVKSKFTFEMLGITRTEITELNSINLIDYLLETDSSNYRQRKNGTIVHKAKDSVVIYTDHSYNFGTPYPHIRTLSEHSETSMELIFSKKLLFPFFVKLNN